VLNVHSSLDAGRQHIGMPASHSFQLALSGWRPADCLAQRCNVVTHCQMTAGRVMTEYGIGAAVQHVLQLLHILVCKTRPHAA
jgi:hypothetical protein